MNRAHTVSVGIAVAPEVVYAFVSDPANLPTWAPGFVQSMEHKGGKWVGQTSLGEARFRFAATNEFGVLDHDVTLAGVTSRNAMRVIANGAGSEVLFTAIQQPEVPDEKFTQDLDTVRADLNKLRTVLERRAAATSTPA